MYSLTVDIIGTIFLLLGWGIIIYGLYRNQREAVESPLVDATNFIPRIASIWEVLAHPARAATWRKPDGSKVFPAMGQDLSEQAGIREDDGKTT